LDIDLLESVFLTDRGSEFENLSQYVKGVIKTAAYSPQANGALERRHKELAMLCRLYDKDPSEVASLLNKDYLQVNFAKELPKPGDLILRYEKRIQKKDKDRWSGPYVVIARIGNRMVEALNLDTRRRVVCHLNDIKILHRPSLMGLSAKNGFIRLMESANEFTELANEQMFEWPMTGKNGFTFVDISYCRDLPEILIDSKIKNDLVIVVPEWKEELFFEMHEAIPGNFIELDSYDLSYENEVQEIMFNFKIWLGIYKQEDLKRCRNNLIQLLETGDVWWLSILKSPELAEVEPESEE
jgi:hypothetical protein